MKVYIVLWRNGRNWAKKTYFAAILERFSGYALLRPMSYVSIFGQMKAISPKHCPILHKFLPEVALKEIKTVFELSLKNSNFYRNRRYPKFARFLQLWAQFPPEGSCGIFFLPCFFAFGPI